MPCADRKYRPRKYRPGSELTTPRSCSGTPSSSKTGRSIHAKSDSNPVHQTTFATSRTRPSSSTGSPSCTPAVLGTRSTPAAARSFRLTRASGRPRERNWSRAFRPIGVFTVSRRVRRNQNGGREQPIRPATGAHRLLARVSSGEQHTVLARRFERDLGSRVPGADDERVALLELRRPPVLAGVQLHDARIQRTREGRDPGALVRAGRDDDVVGLEPPVAGRQRRKLRSPSRAGPRGRRFGRGDRSGRRRPRSSRPRRPSWGTTRTARGTPSPAGSRSGPG